MLRFLILSGYFEMMMYLQVSGRLDQYINVHYRYLAVLSMVLSALLALVQLYLWVKADGKKESMSPMILMITDYQNRISVGLLISY